MRKQLCDALVKRSGNPSMIFLTGDLGFMALESLQDAMKDRFINAGIAEQNMVSVAAALAKQGLEVWVYSIAPFLYARAFEQIRNDVAFHGLPVRFLGNGGGYGYGVMGPTHHAIEDYGVLLTLPSFSVSVPVFDEDMDTVIERAASSDRPIYIRVGRGEPPRGYAVPSYKPWRQLTSGSGPVVIVVGPLAGTYIQAFEKISADSRPNLWSASEMPIELSPPPATLLNQIDSGSGICIIEEHVRHGGFGTDLLSYLSNLNIRVKKFEHLHARAHIYERYGSQEFLRKQSGIDVNSVLGRVGGWSNE